MLLESVGSAKQSRVDYSWAHYSQALCLSTASLAFFQALTAGGFLCTLCINRNYINEIVRKSNLALSKVCNRILGPRHYDALESDLAYDATV